MNYDLYHNKKTIKQSDVPSSELLLSQRINWVYSSTALTISLEFAAISASLNFNKSSEGILLFWTLAKAEEFGRKLCEDLKVPLPNIKMRLQGLKYACLDLSLNLLEDILKLI